MERECNRQGKRQQESRLTPQSEDRQRQGQGRSVSHGRQGYQRELTPQEKRRLQRQIIEKRRKRRQRRMIKRMLLITSLLVFFVVGIPRLTAWGYEKVMLLVQTLTDGEKEHGEGHSTITQDETQGTAQVSVLPQGNVDSQVMDTLKERYQGQENAVDLLARPEKYPDELLTLLTKRPETLEFVLGYPKHKGEIFDADLDEQVTKGEFPRLYQWDKRWGYGSYGDNIMALAGCGPTCLSMVALGLTGDTVWDPIRVARLSEENGYVSDVGTAWDLMTVGAAQMGLCGQELPLDENRMVQQLEKGHPIICSMRPGDFTDTGHFILLVGYEEGAFVVNDPNSIDNSEALWTYEQIQGQIRNLWAFSLE